MATELRDPAEPPSVVIVRTETEAAEDDDLLIGQVDVNNGVLLVKIDREDTFADCSSGPGLGLALEYESSDGCAITLSYLDMDEENCVALIKLLTEALEIERLRARERGYYDWVEAGSPGPYDEP
jgi:hypothetical protein